MGPPWRSPSAGAWATEAGAHPSLASASAQPRGLDRITCPQCLPLQGRRAEPMKDYWRQHVAHGEAHAGWGSIRGGWPGTSQSPLLSATAPHRGSQCPSVLWGRVKGAEGDMEVISVAVGTWVCLRPRGAVGICQAGEEVLGRPSVSRKPPRHPRTSANPQDPHSPSPSSTDSWGLLFLLNSSRKWLQEALSGPLTAPRPLLPGSPCHWDSGTALPPSCHPVHPGQCASLLEPWFPHPGAGAEPWPPQDGPVDSPRPWRGQSAPRPPWVGHTPSPFLALWSSPSGQPERQIESVLG